MPKSKDEISAAYDSPPWWYDIRGFFILTFAYNSTIFHQLNFFGPKMGTRHLEVACGTGTLLELILKWRKWKRYQPVDITGIDYAESMLAGAKYRFKDDPMIHIEHADAAQLVYADRSFDSISVANAIHCLPDIDGALRESFRVLKSGGILVGNVLLYPRGGWPFKQIAQWVNDWGIRKGILYTPYQQTEIKNRLLKAGFELAQEEVSGNCYDFVARKKA